MRAIFPGQQSAVHDRLMYDDGVFDSFNGVDDFVVGSRRLGSASASTSHDRVDCGCPEGCGTEGPHFILK